jgi:NADH-quinone oxidoreductase subunit G
MELLLVDWTYGTEELAGYSELIRQAETAPVISMHSRDAKKSGLSDGDRATLHLPKGSLEVAVKVTDAMAPGVVVLPRHRQLDWRKLNKMPVYLTHKQINKVQG